MAEPSSPQVLRPLAYSSSRHALGLYRCVALSARYTIPPSTTTSSADAAIFSAVAKLVAEQPMLRVGIVGESSNAPAFGHLPEVDLAKHVFVRSSPPAGEDYDAAVDGVHAWAHDQLWPEVETRSPWRVDVVRPGGESPEFEDVVFSFHHALMDGTSAKNFHEELLTNLNQNDDEPTEPTNVLKFPETPVLPEPLENVMNYTNSAYFMGRVLWGEFAPSFLKPAPVPIWAGQPIDLARPHKARALHVDIPAEVVSSLLAESRKHSSSITSLLHALCLASLARRLPAEDAPSFKSSTPINARAYLTVPPEERDIFRVAISVHTHDWPTPSVDALRKPDADLDGLIWQHAKTAKSELLARTATLPADDTISLMKHISDWSSYWGKKQGQQRDASWEVSNVGALKSSGGAKRRISRALFTNGIMIAGGPLSVSVVSVPDGPLTAGITWNEGVAPEELMKGLAEDLLAYSRRLHETGSFRA